MVPCILPVGIEQLRQVGCQGCQGKDIEAVVLEDVGHETSVAATKPVKIPLRNLAPGDVPLPLEAEDSRLKGTQTAVSQAVAQKPSGRMKKIEMGKASEGIGHAVHDKAGSKEIGVECFAVEAHEEPFSLEQFTKAEKRRPLFTVIPGKELPRDECIPLEPAQADEKGHRPRPSGKPCRFRIEEERVAVIQSAQGWVVAQDGQPVHVEGRQIPNAEPAMARGAPGQVAGAEKDPRLVGCLFPGDKILQRDGPAPPGRLRRRYLSFRPPGENCVDPLPQADKFFGLGLFAVLFARCFRTFAGQAL